MEPVPAPQPQANQNSTLSRSKVSGDLMGPGKRKMRLQITSHDGITAAVAAQVGPKHFKFLETVFGRQIAKRYVKLEGMELNGRAVWVNRKSLHKRADLPIAADKHTVALSTIEGAAESRAVFRRAVETWSPAMEGHGINQDVVLAAYDFARTLQEGNAVIWSSVDPLQPFQPGVSIGFQAQRTEDGRIHASFLKAVQRGTYGQVFTQIGFGGSPTGTVVKIPAESVIMQDKVEAFSAGNERDVRVAEAIGAADLVSEELEHSVQHFTVKSGGGALEAHNVAVMKMPQASGDAFDFMHSPPFQRLDYSDRLPVVARLAEQLARGDEKGMILRDRKPENVLMFEVGGQVIANQADLAEAFIVGEDPDPDAIGNMSPEFTIFGDTADVTVASLRKTAVTQQAVTTIELLLAGTDDVIVREPIAWEGRDPANYPLFVVGLDLLGQINLEATLQDRGVGPGLARVLARSLATDREERPTARELADAIHRELSRVNSAVNRPIDDSSTDK